MEWYGLQPAHRVQAQLDIMSYFIQSENFTPEWLSTFLVALSDGVESVSYTHLPDMTDDEKRIRKAEAKVVIAFHYTQMIRFYGGMPWIDHAYAADEIFQFPDVYKRQVVAILISGNYRRKKSGDTEYTFSRS